MENKADNLSLRGVIGYNGKVPGGFVLHPDDEHIIYALGSTIVVRHLTANTQHFLQKGGHDKSVSCMAISPSGKYLASGEETHLGFPATAIIWNLETCEVVHKLKSHKGKVQDLSFSHNESFLATLGGQDDQRIVVWDVASGEAICGAPAVVKDQVASCIHWLNHDENKFVTGGRYHLNLWDLDKSNRKLRPTECVLGSMKRVINYVCIADADDVMYCGTDTGDILEIALGHLVFKRSGPVKKFSQGVTYMAKTKSGNLIVGAGDGTVAVVKKDTFKVVRRLQLEGRITALQLNAKGDHFFVGTAQCNTYLVHLNSFDYELRSTCHSDKINDVQFAANYSDLFATCSRRDIRVWNATTRNELLRIQVPNLDCLCMIFSHDGSSIISGWSDGKIRAFKPQSGQVRWLVHDAHLGGVTSLAGTKDSKTLISGGADGQIRVWQIGREQRLMIASMKEHKGTVTSIVTNDEDNEALSSASDGSCIIWNLERHIRNNAMFASTQFKAAVYHPDESQILTTGTDRKITYWDAVDGNPIRIMDGSTQEINTLQISLDGEMFVTGGADRTVKVWSYDEGFCYFEGFGHSGAINQLKISPDQKTIVSVGDEGAVFVWDVPEMPVNEAE